MPRIPVDLEPAALRENALEVASDAAARDVGERESAASEAPRDVEVEPGRSEQVFAVVVLFLGRAGRA